MEAAKRRGGGAAGDGGGFGEAGGCGCKGIRSCLLCEAAPPPQVTHAASEKGWRRGWELEGGRGEGGGGRRPSFGVRAPLRMCRVLVSQGKGGRILRPRLLQRGEVPSSGCRCIFKHYIFYKSIFTVISGKLKRIRGHFRQANFEQWRRDGNLPKKLPDSN